MAAGSDCEKTEDTLREVRGSQWDNKGGVSRP